MLLNQSSNVQDISHARHHKETAVLYSVIDVADWYSTTFYIANLLNLPLGPSLVDKQLSLIEGSLPQKLGHRNVGEFITSTRADNGLGIDWSDWKDNVKAARYKQEFGINSQDRTDILAQVEDVKMVIGRLPISSNEFNHGKDIIENKRIVDMEEEHKAELDSMNASVKGLMRQLDSEQKERHQAIERMNEALNQLESLKEKQELKDEMHNEVMSDYVKRSMYEKIIEQMESAETSFEETTQEYLDKILKLEHDKVSLTHSLQVIKDKHARLLEKISAQKTISYDVDTKSEIIKLKMRLAEVLKAHITEKKKTQKLHIISSKQQQLLNHYKKRNQSAASISQEGNSKSVLLTASLSTVAIGLLGMSFMGIL